MHVALKRSGKFTTNLFFVPGPVRKSWRLAALGLTLACLARAAMPVAWADSLDGTFVQGGTIDAPIYAVSVGPQTNIWIGGRFSTVYGLNYQYLALLHPDGTLNTNLDPTTLGGATGEVHALVADGNGNVFVGGQNGLVRLIPVGNGWLRDPSFAGNYATSPVQFVTSIAVRPPTGTAQDIWVAGNSGGNLLALYDINGVRNAGFAPAAPVGGGYVSQVRYVSGAGTSNSFSGEQLIVSGGFGGATLLPNGSGLSGPFDVPPFAGFASCVALRKSVAVIGCPSGHGELLLAGAFTPGYGLNNLSSGLWINRYGGDATTFFHTADEATNSPNDSGAYASAIEVLDGGDVVVAGSFSRIGGHNVNNFAHLAPNGTVLSSQAGVAIPVFNMTKQPDGKFLVVGESAFSPFTGKIMRVQVDPARDVTFSSPPTDQTVYEGEGFCFSSGVDGFPAPDLVWLQGGSLQTNRTNTSFCVGAAVLGDTGNYRLQATPFCGGPLLSQSAHLTVLPTPPPPANDLFANATVLTGISTMAGSYARSSALEVGEPTHTDSFGGYSVWFKWTAPFTGSATLEVSGSGFEPGLEVFTGNSLNSLSLVVSNCNQICFTNFGIQNCFCSQALPTVAFNVTLGVTYYIAVGGPPPVGALGSIQLQVNPVSIDPAAFTIDSHTGVSLNVAGPNGVTMILDKTTSFSPPYWQPVCTNLVSGGGAILTDPHALDPNAVFYRVRLQ